MLASKVAEVAYKSKTGGFSGFCSCYVTCKKPYLRVLVENIISCSRQNQLLVKRILRKVSGSRVTFQKLLCKNERIPPHSFSLDFNSAILKLLGIFHYISKDMLHFI